MSQIRDHSLFDPALAAPVAGARDYWALLKPRVMSLVIFTAGVGLLLAPGNMHPVLAFAALLSIALGAGAAGALNMWYDRDMDALMKRTHSRPLPAGRMAPGTALGFGLTLAVTAVSLMALMINWLAAALLAFTIVFYALVYTVWLKRATPQNIVIGGAAGALPPLVGWAAATGGISLEPIVLFAIIFLWTPPHFWALSLYCRDDYQRAGIPMLPVVAGEAATRRHILGYSLILVPVGVLPAVLGMASVAYGVLAGVFGILFIGLAVQVWRSRDHGPARRLFRFSILYLAVLFAALLVDGVM